MKIVIVGGVAGGMSAATRLRRLMEDAEIIVFEKGPYVSFANCGLPYYLSGEISDRENLLVQTPESLAARFCLDVRPNHEVTAIFPENKTVEVVHGGQKHLEQYDVLVLSPGAKPVVPSIPGITEADNVFSIRNVPDIDKVMHALEKQPNRAVIVGAGFIGLEMAENLKKRGLEVMVIEQAPHILPTLDEEMAAFIEKELSHQGVEVITSHAVARFEDHGKRLRLDDGRTIPADLVILSIGVRPDNQLAVTAGIELGIRGGILVDERYQTNIPDIYAVGDAIVVKQLITGKDALISLASPANRQGRQVADTISGISRRNQGSIGTAIIRTFGMTAASTGLSERTAKENELSFEVVHVSGKDHASYYPEATDILLKLIFHPETGEIYGAQGVGAKGVDKRIDILATAIKGHLKIFDLPELELTYAPPFGSAKDPVNMLGYAAMNIAEGLSETVQWHELPTELAKGKILLDVRTAEELEKGKFKEAKHIPLNELRDRLNELDSQQEYIVSCHSGLRSYLAERILKQSGYHVKNLDGAFSLYQTVRPEELIYPNK
ncbi:TPA: FAD-dependent oxidoreductase [Enterococcus faecium]|uniref:FAD-dependent oxidoreductase n=1 Tax=Enterococcus TaxID=1350 RepID=UPI00027C7804|nr:MULTISPECIES: FAD-dependent oxidoreductase [Enterococcus]AWX46750.1 CoA-disulfide reductase [Enterococcus faecium]EGP4723509.1 FAD-dependent oxidoreductase [Enterococcus faecium]EGP4743112.1 FAD-dependent oxidoreductase [Enterococcus faecium]EGP5425915.1 CoA-disulfide reductase [Enterococcus faecium]EGP5655672.1 CoA-disulfide reductase [Enterococcus faecium]